MSPRHRPVGTDDPVGHLPVHYTPLSAEQQRHACRVVAGFAADPSLDDVSDAEVTNTTELLAALATPRPRQPRQHRNHTMTITDPTTAAIHHDADRLIQRIEDLSRRLEQAQRDRNLALADARVSAEITAAMSRDLHQARRDNANHLARIRELKIETEEARTRIVHLLDDIDSLQNRAAQTPPHHKQRRLWPRPFGGRP